MQCLAILPWFYSGGDWNRMYASSMEASLDELSSVGNGLEAGIASVSTSGSSKGQRFGQQVANFASDDLLQKHVVQQGEFGSMTKDEYLTAAQKHVTAPEGGDVLVKTRSKGDVLVYNQTTNEFGVVTNQGVIRTYFKPTDGLDYFNRQ